jgi:hypothetical protein
MASIEGLQSELVADLKTELKNDPNFDAEILEIKVKNAIRDVRSRRCYGATSYSESMIASDLESYYSAIRNVALYDYNQAGAEFQSSHDENDISRTWVDRDKLFNGVVAFVKIF